MSSDTPSGERDDAAATALYFLECPCCGCAGALGEDEGRKNLFYDGQELICGCEGQVMCDAETAAYIDAAYCCCDDPDLSAPPPEHGGDSDGE